MVGGGIRGAWVWINVCTRLLVHIILLYRSSAREIVEEDLKWYHPEERRSSSLCKSLGFVLLFDDSFRNVFYHRMQKEHFVLTKLASRLLAPIPSLRIRPDAEIGPGFYVQHGYCTLVGALRIGKNCHIYHEVTIGTYHTQDADKYPEIGDNVTLNAGAKIIGNVKIGDNSIIGANAVVVKDVPPNCTVVGVPAYIVRRDGEKTKEPL